MKRFGSKLWSFIRRHPYISGAALIVLALAAVVLRLALAMGLIGQAHFTPADAPNQPMGVGKGIHPGRVVWVHAPGATSWDARPALVGRRQHQSARGRPDGLRFPPGPHR